LSVEAALPKAANKYGNGRQRSSFAPPLTAVQRKLSFFTVGKESKMSKLAFWNLKSFPFDKRDIEYQIVVPIALVSLFELPSSLDSLEFVTWIELLTRLGGRLKVLTKLRYNQTPLKV
jgi:hypothetical protein